jgi:ring-1,2-phenylacetyl-CoA epoxidase subunit PaaC
MSSAYEALNESGDVRWAFGTGFSDPLAGVDTAVPPGADGADLAAYALMLGDDALILSQRLGEWVTRAPELEEEVALANIALDLLGQARLLLARAGAADGSGRGEDDYAFRRDEGAFLNVRLAETANGDFASTMARLLVLSTWRLALFVRLTASVDPVLAAVAAKGVPELTYHREHAADWVVRLGDGTEESHRRMQTGLDAVWPLVDELFRCHPVERRLAAASVTVDPAGLRAEFDGVLDAVVTASGLHRPEVAGRSGVGGRTGRDGVHTEALGPLLAEMQSVARAHPGATW